MKIEEVNYANLYEISFFQPKGWNFIVPHFEYYINSTFCHPIKIVERNKIIGVGSVILNEDSAWLAHIIVHKNYRKKGIGDIIVKKLLEICSKNKIKSVFLDSTEEGFGLYKKNGFETQTEYLNYKGTFFEKGNDVKYEFIKPYEPKYLKQILELDFFVTNEKREKKLIEELKGAMVFAKNKSEIQGFFLPFFGEGLVIAKNNFAGFELLKLRLCSRDFAVVFKENEFVINFLNKIGFKQNKSSKRMVFGENRPYKPKLIFNRANGKLG